MYLVIDETQEKYIVFDSLKYNTNITSITGNFIIIKGPPKEQGTILSDVCEETCKLNLKHKYYYLQIEVIDNGFLKLENITYIQSDLLYNN